MAERCYHIIERYPSMNSRPALKRCYRSRKTAETVAKRGATGDRADYQLDPNRQLGVVGCYGENCECAKWPGGHNAGAIPNRPEQLALMCEDCGQKRRETTELVDPSTEEPRLLCNTCFNRAAGKLLRRHQWTPNRRVHADDPAFALVAEAGYLVRQSS